MKLQKLLIAVLIVLVTTFVRLGELEETTTAIGGDERGYSHYALYALASSLKYCHSLFGETATRGFQMKPEHRFLQETFSQTHIDCFITGEINDSQIIGVPGYPFLCTLETVLGRWNATALSLSLSLWVFGADYAGCLPMQSILLLALSSALVFERCCLDFSVFSAALWLKGGQSIKC